MENLKSDMTPFLFADFPGSASNPVGQI